MKKSCLRAVFFLMMIFAVGFSPCMSQARGAAPDNGEKRDMSREMGMNPEVCAALQKQINTVVEISQSSLKDDEKITKLVDVLSQAMAAMTKSAEKDSEIDQIVKQYSFFFKAILSSVLASDPSGKAAPGLKDELQKLKILTSNYVNMAKMMCPEIKLPESVNK
jgi:hypothetical protein